MTKVFLPIRIEVLFTVVLLAFTVCKRENYGAVLNMPGAEEVSIGAAYPMSMMDERTHYRWALETAVEEVNLYGGVMGKPLNLMLRDDRNDARTAMQIAETFHRMGVTAVIGHWSSDVCYYVEDIYEERGIVLMIPGANSRIVFEQEFQNIFRITPDDGVYAAAMAEYASQQGFQNMAVYYVENTYGSSMAMAIEREMAKRGIIVSDRISGISAVTARSVLRRWRAFGCNGLIIAADSSGVREPLEYIQAAGNTIPIFLTSSSIQRRSFEKSMAGYTEQVYMFEYASTGNAESFLKKYIETWDDSPAVYEISGYAAVHLLARAMNTCQSLSSADISAWLKNIKNFPSMAGNISYNPQTQEFEGQNLQIKQLEPQ